MSNLPPVPAGVCCLKHDIWGEFDELTDVARFHRHPRKKGPIVPSFVFFVEGALVGLTCMALHVLMSHFCIHAAFQAVDGGVVSLLYLWRCCGALGLAIIRHPL